ncbi:MAG TPA: hypothetical protein VNH82_00800 [Candidatus Dormibacteraeota bacterium]|nr:hypothetical protein [Candidatus Dormibacteraeota bacterium]
MPDDYLTVDEVAAQLALPLEMIQRRIESGDIPVHWVEVQGKLEMRISAAEIGVDSSGPAQTPFPGPEVFSGDESIPSAEEDTAPAAWSVRQSEYPSEVWTPTEDDPPAVVAPPPTPWETESGADPSATLGAEVAEPVWRQDPGGWEDEPLDAPVSEEVTPELSPFSPSGAETYFPLEEEAEFATPPPATTPFSASAEPVDEVEAAPPFAGDDEEEEAIVPVEQSLDLESPLPSESLGVPEMVEVPRPSALAAAQGPESSLAINSLDARELVAGLFERWERALEQRIQAEQRLRFEAELERRLRQVRDLRQELENTRKSTAAQLAEREQEVLALRNRLREQGAPAKKGGLFRR